jgi:hypothetical protein
VGILPLHRQGREHGEGHPVVDVTDLRGLFLAVRLLAKIVAGKAQHHQPPLGIRPVNGLQGLELGRKATVARGVDDQQGPARERLAKVETVTGAQLLEGDIEMLRAVRRGGEQGHKQQRDK